MKRHFFNPFTMLFETQTYPHARTLRTGFLEKLKDTWSVVFGCPVLRKQGNLGLFDYLTLGLGYFTLLLWDKVGESDSFLAKIAYIPVGLITLAFSVSRVIASFGITLLFSPLVALIQGVTTCLSKQLFTDALSLEGSNPAAGNKTVNIQKALNNADVTLNQIQMSLEGEHDSEEMNQQSGYTLHVKKTQVQAKIPSLDIFRKQGIAKIEASADPSTVTTNRQLHALFKLNLGDITTNLEENKALDGSEKRRILGG